MTQRRVLLTGASRGIGRAIAIDLARAGFELALAYRSDDAAAEAVLAEVRGAGAEARLLKFDISDRAATQSVLEAELEERGAFWGVVLNAGRTADQAFAMLDGDDWDSVLRTNLDGFYNVLRPLIMPMVRLRDGGRVVTLSSVAGVAGNAGQVNYSASKAGLVGATKSLALEVAKRGITVNAVAPGFVRTDMIADLDEKELVARVPLRRLGTPEEIAAVVGFLFSAGAGYMTGQVLSVNGGMI